jgi:hypothetical protein
LKQLDEYFTLRGVGKQMQLAVALRSITDASAKSWVSAIAHNLQFYDQFKVTFVRAFWSPVVQSNVRKSIYQDKYNKQDGLSLSAHFLKYSVVASYLQPKMMDSELINALMSHFSLNIQRSLNKKELPQQLKESFIVFIYVNMTKLSVVIIKAYQYSQLHSKLYLILFY